MLLWAKDGGRNRDGSIFITHHHASEVSCGEVDIGAGGRRGMCLMASLAGLQR
jgi:hypothetical protein